MGSRMSCCDSESVDVETPDRETLRQIQAQAAEKRLRENETRGIKNPEQVKKMQMQKRELEERQNEAARNNQQEQGLKWTVNN